MDSIQWRNPHYDAALNLIEQAKCNRYSNGGRRQFLKEAQGHLDIALKEEGGEKAPEFIQNKVEDAKRRIKKLREELG